MPDTTTPCREDPAVTNGRRESLIVLITWLVAMAYTVGYCYLHGYGRRIEELTFVMGFPDWVFWGVVVPWTVCVAFSWLFSYVLMRDSDLGVEVDAEGEGTEAE